VGEKIVIDTSMVDSVKSDPRLNFQKAADKGLFAHMRGFEALKTSGQTTFVRDMVRIHLTRHLCG
jgi:hypothetical protein